MNFESDLEHIIKRQFDEHGICYEDNIDVRCLSAHYLEMLNRRIVPIPRGVLFSEEIHDSLGKLTHETKVKQREKAAEAWGAVFLIRYLLTEGKNLNGFLSKRIDSATVKGAEKGFCGISVCTIFISARKLKHPGLSNDRTIYCLRL